MKYNTNKKMTRGAKRTLNDFMCTMFTMLSEKNFEEITVGELCKCANYPRATFYNYFDDKFDLLNYCWIGLTQEIHLEEYHHMAHEEALYIFFDRIYDYSKKNEKKIRGILTHNSEIGYMFSSFQTFMNGKMRELFHSCTMSEKMLIPKEILANHYSNTLLLIWQWCILKNQDCTKAQACAYLRYLVGNL